MTHTVEAHATAERAHGSARTCLAKGRCLRAHHVRACVAYTHFHREHHERTRLRMPCLPQR
eukprot:6182940-Pleurochrysis_carterae.AAC.2